jgi:hypothetical protein
MFIYVVLEFELKALHLLGSFFTTWANKFFNFVIVTSFISDEPVMNVLVL